MSLFNGRVLTLLFVCTESPVIPPEAVQTDDSGTPSADSSEVVTSSQEATTQQPKKMRLTYDQYKQLANMLVMRMRKEEEQAEGTRPP